MKKYKLIKEYPGSPKLGTIVEHHYTNSMYGFCVYDTENSDSWKEFWEEVVEKDYEVLSLINTTNSEIITYEKGGVNYPNGLLKGVYKNKDYFVSCFIGNNNPWKIHSVKRLSDGEIFTVGDEVRTNVLVKSDVIKEIRLEFKTKMCLIVGSINAHISQFEKIKQPLFTTEDGVDIFEGDKYFGVNEKYWIVLEPKLTCKINYETFHKNKHNFSTKEKAEEYIIMNKPCLSINDLFSYNKLIQKDSLGKLIIGRIDTFKELVEKKLKNN